MSKRELSPVCKELIAAKKRIENPENWCRGARLNFEGQRCALGALECDEDHYEFAEEDHPEAVAALAFAATAIEPLSHSDRGPEWTVAKFNNSHPDGHAAVLRLFDHAIATEIQKANSDV